jgi:ubiquitin-protein ligase
MLKCEPLDWSSDCQHALDGEEPQGGTNIYSTLQETINRLLSDKKKFQNAQARIILLTDGEDDGKRVPPIQILNLLCQNQILLDSFFVSRDFDKQLIALTRLSGGCAFYDDDPVKTAKFFQRDELVNLQRRKFKIPNSAPSSDVFSNYVANFKSHLNQGLELEVPLAVSIAGRFVTSKKALVIAQNNSNAIISELHIIHSKASSYIVVCPHETNYKVWRVALLGSHNSEYQNRWWYLSIEFTDRYPYQAPLIHFVFSPFHINISEEGTICMDALSEGYSHVFHAIDLFDKIRDLMAHPNPNTPIDFERWSLPKNQFLANIQTYNIKNSKLSPNDWIQIWNAIDDPTGQIVLAAPNFVPADLRCPISQTLIHFPVQASNGIIYDKNSLQQYLRMN